VEVEAGKSMQTPNLMLFISMVFPIMEMWKSTTPPGTTVDKRPRVLLFMGVVMASILGKTPGKR
jgi:hypothetical protein